MFLNIRPLMVLVLTLSLLNSCTDKRENVTDTPDPAFRKYISGFTSGTIYRDGETTIVLQEPSPRFTTIGASLDSDILEIEPKVEGSLTWLNDRTIRFLPSEKLKSGETYHLTFHLDKVLDVENEYRTFQWTLYTAAQGLKVEVNSIKSYSDTDIRWNQVKGVAITADFLEDEIVEKMMEVNMNGKDYPITWVHQVDGRTHRFMVDSVERTEPEQTMNFNWTVDHDDFETTGETTYTVPSISNFSYRSAKVSSTPSQHLVIEFTDPVDTKQGIKGLVSLADQDDFRFEFSSNVVKAYPKSRLSGNKMLRISKKVRNTLGYTLKEDIEVEVSFSETNPDIQSVFSGTILPSTDGKVFPFRAVNLRAVDVEIKRVFEDNMVQYLQVNELGGDRQLSRVGRTVLRKKVNLTSNKPLDYGVWNTFTLDLDELIRQEPGAIYQVKLSFRPSYSIYPCDEAINDKSWEDDDSGFAEEEVYDEYDDWEYYDDYSYRSGYDWEERNNPCHISYYMRRGFSHSILATDLGVIAKRGKDGKNFIAVSNIKTSKPVSAATVLLYDYQNQLLQSGRTGGDGTVTINSKKKPYLALVEHGSQKAYLKLGDGNSLSMSQFDTRGREVQDGLKGFIYGERGVWRPGDTLFLSFILEDATQKLPKGHPVILEMTDPRGQLVHREVKNDGVNGFYTFQVVTDAEAPTGMWNCTVKVGAAKFYKRLAVEAIKPNRLKMDLDFGEFIVEKPGGQEGTLTAKWLHGAKAKNLKAEVSMVLNSTGVKPKGWEEFHFRDPAKDFDVSEEVIFQGRVDEAGLAPVPMDPNTRSTAPGMLRAHFTTKVFEEGGGHSIDRFNIPYSPFPTYIGIKMPKSYRLEAGSKHQVQVVAVDMHGEPVEIEGLRVEVYNISWRWWWDRGRDYLAKYISSSSNHRIAAFDIEKFKGKSSFTLEVPEHEWSRYLVRVVDTKGGHSTGTRFYGYVPYRPGGKMTSPPGGATMLTFETDKEKYRVGENALVRFPTAGVGRALVTVEDGTHIISKEWVDVLSDVVEYNFKITPEMAPNAYVNVTLLQPHDRKNDLPLRMYGVTPILVDNPKTILHPTIEMPDKIRPETTVDIKVSEKDRRAMTYTLAVVDEGLLDLTGFKTPAPHSTFYAREGLGVKSWDKYDDVIGAFGGIIEKLLSVGGDEDLDKKDQSKVNRFKPMVRFIGPFKYSPGKTNSHSIDIPNYIGSVRVMVIAGQDASYGHTEKTVQVSKPLMVLATLPRVLGPEEEVTLPISVFAMEPDVKNVDVSVELTGPLSLVGSADMKMTFSEPDEQMAFFKVKTGSGTGKAKAVVRVKSGSHTAHHDIEIPVRQSRLPESRGEMLLLDAGESGSLDYSHFAMDGTKELSLELSSMPSIDLDGRLGYLTRYPHGCAEQTVSAAFPQLYLKSFLGDKEKLAEKSMKNIVDVCSILGKFQRSDGSFARWPNRYNYDNWITSYVGHFMVEARNAGYTVPDNVYDSWLTYQKRAVRGDYSLTEYYGREYGEKARAYRLFTLALAGHADIASMNRLKNSKLLDKPAIYMLAAAYHLAGQKDVAQKLVNEHSHFTPKNRKDGYSYSNIHRDKAILLDCMVIMDMKKQALPLVQQIAEALNDDGYMNTHTSSWCLRAMLSLDIFERKDMDYTASLNGNKVDELRSQLTFKRYSIKDFAENGKLDVENKSAGPLYARLIQTGVPKRETVKPVKSNVDLLVKYINMDGKVIDISKIEQGTEFMIDMTVTNPNTEDMLEHLALTVILPSGWEPNIDRMDAPNRPDGTDVADYTDIRDDRVNMYFWLDQNDELRRSPWRKYRKHFRFTVNASYSGNYYMPGVLCESMYDPEVVFRSDGKTVEVYRVGGEE